MVIRCNHQLLPPGRADRVLPHVALQSHPVLLYGRDHQLSPPAKLTAGRTGASNMLYATLTQQDLDALKVRKEGSAWGASSGMVA
jgi:hypothetical protein